MSGATINGVSDDLIYTGVWTNWSHGPIRGATLTLTKRNGGLLTAFLALFVTIVGRSFWRIFCFIVHARLSYKTAQDGLYHQRQAVLRNADASMGGLKSFIQLAWSWRKGSFQAWRRMTPLIGSTLILTIGFYVASVFSSQISTVTANEVLITSPRCGLYVEASDTEELFTEMQAYTSKLVTASASYAQQCYSDTANAQRCSIWVKDQLPQAITRNASCPFPGGNRLCTLNATNIRIDTGLLDSHNDLGMNAPPRDRFKFRNVIECAPLRTDNYSRVVPGADDSTNSSALQILYGSQTDGPHKNDSVSFEWPLHGPRALLEYAVRSHVWQHGGWSPVFTPIPELVRADADTTIFYLMANSVKFMHPTDDKLFAAHTPVHTFLYSYSDSEMQVYMFDGVVHPLGCSLQYQFCFSAAECTMLSMWQNTTDAALRMTATERQKASLGIWIRINSLFDAEIGYMVDHLGASALVARESFDGGVQGPLPLDQWQIEVARWQATTMAYSQRLAVEFATGPSDIVVANKTLKPKTKVGRQLCQNQKVKSASYTSFSILGLCITFAIGGIIILLELTAESLFQCIQRRRGVGLYRRLEWISNETLQLQRMAHEELGAGTWIGADHGPPRTEGNECLAVLDLSNEKHPRLFHDVPAENEGKPISANSGRRHSLSTEITRVGTTSSSNRRLVHQSSRSPPMNPSSSRPSSYHTEIHDPSPSPTLRSSCG